MDVKITDLPMRKSNRRFREDIQWLRGLAVFMVVLFHTKTEFFPNGYLGVDVFFVVSGYVVAPLLFEIYSENNFKKTLFKLSYFYKRRFFRLAPTFSLVIFSSALLVFLLASPSEHARIARQGLYSLFLVGNVGAAKFSADYFAPIPNPLIHTWSLAVEEQYYIFAPIFIGLLALIKRFAITIAFLCLFLTFSFLTFLNLNPQQGGALFGFSNSIDFAYYSVISRFWQFALGLLVFLILDRLNPPKKSPYLGLAISILLAGILMSPIGIDPKLASTISTLMTTATIFFGVNNLKPALITKALSYLGYRSYSLYLVHMPLLYIAKNSPLLGIGEDMDRKVQSVLALLLSLVLSAFLYERIETRYLLDNVLREYNPSSTLKRVTILSLTTPLLFLVVMNLGTENRYWGLVKDLDKPPYAGELDPKCERDSEDGPLCSYLVRGAQTTVLLIGDSHAAHYSEALLAAANREKWNTVIWTHRGCIVTFKLESSFSTSNSCLKVNQKMLAWVKSERPEAVIISQYVRKEFNQKLIRESILEIKKYVQKIALVENNPVFPDENDFMVSRPILMKQYNPPKKFRLSEMQNQDLLTSTEMMKWARSNSIEPLYIHQLFCDSFFCRRHDGSGWLYFDDDHLSVLGAGKATPIFRDFLAREPSS